MSPGPQEFFDLKARLLGLTLERETERRLVSSVHSSLLAPLPEPAAAGRQTMAPSYGGLGRNDDVFSDVLQRLEKLSAKLTEKEREVGSLHVAKQLMERDLAAARHETQAVRDELHREVCVGGRLTRVAHAGLLHARLHGVRHGCSRPCEQRRLPYAQPCRAPLQRVVSPPRGSRPTRLLPSPAAPHLRAHSNCRRFAQVPQHAAVCSTVHGPPGAPPLCRPTSPSPPSPSLRLCRAFAATCSSSVWASCRRRAGGCNSSCGGWRASEPPWTPRCH
jgi:hypothetical protein